MDRSTLEEQKRLAGLSPRYDFRLDEAETTHPDSPEDDQDLAATPPVTDEDPPDTTGAGASKHWDMYRKHEQSLKAMAEKCDEMLGEMSFVNEAEMDGKQNRALKMARMEMKKARLQQGNAFRAMAEFGATMLGK